MKVLESKIFDFNEDGLAECIVEEISDEDKELARYKKYKAFEYFCEIMHEMDNHSGKYTKSDYKQAEKDFVDSTNAFFEKYPEERKIILLF